MTANITQFEGSGRGEEEQRNPPRDHSAPDTAHGIESDGSGARAADVDIPRRLVGQSAPSDSRRSLISVPGGRFLMGTDYPGGIEADGEGPVRPVFLASFEVDAFPVTNDDFAAFASATGYKTDAERYGSSYVFWSQIPMDQLEELIEGTIPSEPWWCKVRGASWKHPEGPGSNLENRRNHPVVHVSWDDAACYAAWAGKNLPTEAQWEYAARGGLVQKLFPWGNELTPGGMHLCNVWQGEFPFHDTGQDGYTGTCPVDSFPPNGYGLFSVIGNTWEWCADWFTASFSAAPEVRDPRGPAGGKTKVIKGGSFLSNASYCSRYRLGARSRNAPDGSASNIGFRCVRK
jgi:formylglycine-generating enzyme required for sulfatase activity